MNYKGYYIDRNLLAGKFTVVYQGDEVIFDTMVEAMAFINEITKEE